MELIVRSMAADQGADPDTAWKQYNDLSEPVSPVEDLFKLEALGWSLFNAAKPALRDKDRIGLIAWVWMVQAFRHTHAAFLLVTSGMHDSVPLQVRSAWEHGAYLSALAGVEDPDDFMEQLAHKNIEAMENTVRELGDIVGAEEASFLDLTMRAAKSLIDETDDVWARRVQQVCDKLIEGKQVYAYYRALSERCHVGFGSAELGMYAAFSKGGLQQPRLSHEPHEDLMLPTLLSWALGATVWAGWSADKLLGTPIFGDALKPIADLGFHPLDLKPKKKRRS